MDRRMRRGLKIGGVVLGVLFFALAGLVLYLKSLDFNAYKPQLQSAVLDATGRSLGIDGQLKLSVSLHPSLVVEGVHLGNAPGFSRPNMIDVRRLEIQIRLLPLLSGELLVEHIALIGPDVLLERLPDGRDNWTFAAVSADQAAVQAADAVPAESEDSGAVFPRVHRLVIREAKLAYRDAAKGGVQRLAIPELELWEGNGEHDDRLHLRAHGEVNHLPVKLQGSIESPAMLLADQPLGVALHATAPGLELTLSGRIERPLEASGMALDVDLSSPGMGSMAKLLRLPPVLGMAMHVKAAVTDDADGYLLKGLEAEIGKNDVAGEVHIGMRKARPRVDATLASNAISLLGLLPDPAPAKPASSTPATASAGKSPAARVLPDEPLDLAMLQQVEADIDWKVKRLVMPDVQLSDVQLKLALHDGQLDVSPFRAKVAGGEMRTTLTLKARTSPAVLDITASGRGIMAGQLLAMRAGKDDASLMQGGSLDFDVRLGGRGRSVAGLMADSNGRIKLQMGEGKIKSTALDMVGGDMLMSLADRLNPFSDKQEYMELKCGVVHFRLQDGKMLSEKGIAFETTRMNILSEGEIDLHDERIDLSFGTEPREGIGVNLSNMVNVVKLGGTLAEPGLVVDAAKTGMAAARTAGAVMTGGLSLLGEGLFNRVAADATPCKTALQMN